MDTQTSLNNTSGLGDRNYGSFTLREFIHHYVRSAIDFLSASNGKSPTFAEYSQNIRARISGKFDLSQRRDYYILRPLECYGHSDINGFYPRAPINFFGLPGGHLKVRFADNIDRENINKLVEITLEDIGLEVDKRLGEEFLGEGVKYAPPPPSKRIASFEDWLKSVMKRSSNGDNRK